MMTFEVSKSMDDIPTFSSDPNEGENGPTRQNNDEKTPKSRSRLEQLWNNLLKLGLGETALKVGTGVASLVLILIVVWIMGKFFLKDQLNQNNPADAQPTSVVTLPASASGGEMTPGETLFTGVSRLVKLHTNLPSHPRSSIVDYNVQTGDSLFGIAEKYGLKPESLFWSNKNVLGDNPDNLIPGVVIKIPPIDGAIYEWHSGDGLNGVAKYYKVTTDAIINWDGNNLDPATIGDLSFPNIAAGTMLFVPGGQAEFTDWLPHITRATASDAQILGPGFCGSIDEGPVGTGTFLWPTTETFLSGYDYNAILHRGIDIAGAIGNSIFAADTGVVVYSGWNTLGYGYLIIVDHGNGWQTVYAHLSERYVECGAYVYQGDVIAAMGSTGNSTGPHLHFELRNSSGPVNPWDFLVP